jgi:two-component system sensor histidine kinase AlgZ
MFDWAAFLSTKNQPISQVREGYFLPDLYRGEGLLGVIVTTQAVSILIALGSNGLVEFSWALLGRVSLLAMGIALFSALALTVCEQFLLSARPVRSALLSYILIMIVAGLSAVIAEQAMVFSLPARSLSWPRVSETLFCTAITAAILLRYLSVQQHLWVLRRAELEARTRAQQAQIRPHFLFNSMNMIASLVASDPLKAERAVEDLAELYRRILNEPQTLIPLREELSICRSYLALEKMRLGDRLEIEWQVGDYGNGVKIPCLTLQPVLENAVYHGIQLLQGGGKIEIKIGRKGDRLSIAVRNPHRPRIRHNKGSNMAMENIKGRLKAYFGSNAVVKSEVIDGSYVTYISYRVNR